VRHSCVEPEGAETERSNVRRRASGAGVGGSAPRERRLKGTVREEQRECRPNCRQSPSSPAFLRIYSDEAQGLERPRPGSDQARALARTSRHMHDKQGLCALRALQLLIGLLSCLFGLHDACLSEPRAQRTLPECADAEKVWMQSAPTLL
jgi:hypothetical protein